MKRSNDICYEYGKCDNVYVSSMVKLIKRIK